MNQSLRPSDPDNLAVILASPVGEKGAVCLSRIAGSGFEAYYVGSEVVTLLMNKPGSVKRLERWGYVE